ncbi:MAG: hypothetical protein IPN40_16450 [Uliginosibacterium sp.]|nr:hypothetical protein [Uliginosibacterium sp.]
MRWCARRSLKVSAQDGGYLLLFVEAGNLRRSGWTIPSVETFVGHLGSCLDNRLLLQRSITMHTLTACSACRIVATSASCWRRAAPQ